MKIRAAAIDADHMEKVKNETKRNRLKASKEKMKQQHTTQIGE